MDYLKCLWANRYCLAGVILFFIGSILFICSMFSEGKELLWVALSFVYFGFSLLLNTGFGIETYGAYKKACQHIIKYGNLDRFSSGTYCKRVGINLAGKALEHKVNTLK